MSESVLNKKEIYILSVLLLLAILVLILVFADIAKIKDFIKNPIVGKSDNSFLPIFYFTDNYNGSEGQLTVFQASSDLTVSDKKIVNLDPKYNILSANGDVALLSKEGKTLELLKLPSGQIDTLVEVKKGRRVMSAKLLQDDNLFVYITSSDNLWERAEDSWLHILDIKSGETKDFFLSKESPIYSSFRIASVRDNGSEVLLLEMGGDGGGIWAKAYVLDTITKKLSEVKDISEGSYFSDSVIGDYEQGFYNVPAMGLTNDVGTKSVYVKKVKYNENDLETDLTKDYAYGCLKDYKSYYDEGQSLYIHDFETGEDQQIYVNLSAPDNFCKNIVRRIDSVVWLDNETLLFSTPDQIFRIKSDGSSLETVYEYERYYDPKTVKRPYISYATSGFIMFREGQILDLKSGKMITVNKNPNLSQVTFLNF